MRSKAATRRRLTDDQKGVLGSGMAMLLLSERAESDRETIVRICGSFEDACEMWFAHRDELMRYDVMPGRRGPGFWVCELGMESSPDLDDQAGILRGLGLLADDEEQTLAEWDALRHRPELPTDLGIGDVTAIDPIDHTPEDTHDRPGDIDAAPVPARSQATTKASTEAEAREEPEGLPETPVTPPRILPMRRGIDDRKPAGLEGWE